MTYKHILLATDLGPQSIYLLKRAVEISNVSGSQLSVLHVVEPPITYATQFAQRETAVKELKSKAQEQLERLCKTTQREKMAQILTVGSPFEEILRVGQSLACDLVMVASHGVGGYTHLLGSTTQSLMRSDRVDVLIVQVRHLESLINAMWHSYANQTQPSAKSQMERPVKPTLSGSEKGFGDPVKRGPRLTPRPPNTPYRGGTRERTEDEEDDPNKKD